MVGEHKRKHRGKFRYEWAFATALVFTLVTLGVLAHSEWRSYGYFRQRVALDIRLDELGGIIAHLDEALTMSARMGAATGDPQWEKRYRVLEPQLDTAIQRVRGIAPNLFIGEKARQTDEANRALVRMEMRSFELVRLGQRTEAEKLLTSPDYLKEKQAYAVGSRQIQATLHELESEQLGSMRNRLFLSLLFAGLAVLLLPVAWFLVLRVVQEHDAQRLRAETELEKHRDHLEELVALRTEELGTAKDVAELANRTKSIFLANMSHEIRTPMNAVLGFAQLLARDSSLSPPAHAKLATILKSGEHLLGIINDILEMSRIEAGRIEVRAESIDLFELLDDLAVMFRLRAEEKGLSVGLDLGTGIPAHIRVDLGKLRQVLTNLLGNAVKFTRKGAITLRAMSVGAGRIAVEVQDTGIGISAEDQKWIFNPFARARAGEQVAGGTGLGLAISREYARLLGGEISVKSRVGEGSCFRFEFQAPITHEVAAAVRPACRVVGLAPGQGAIRILVVDDRDTNRDLLREMLAPLGFVVDEARDGEEAIAKAKAHAPRIVLMDLVMPGMGGIKATQILRASCPGESMAIIGISASAFEESKQEFIDAGLHAFIAKPFREQELFDVLARHAGVVFKSESVETPPPMDVCIQRKPTLDKMPAEWRSAFAQALSLGSVTRLRGLGEEAAVLDPVLSDWLLGKLASYDLTALRALRDVTT